MKLKIGATFLLTILGISGLILASNFECAEESTPPAQFVEPAAPGTLQYRGLAIQVQSGYEPVERYVPLLREIAGLGANTVLLCTAGFMEHAESQQIYLEARKTPAQEEFKQIIRAARELDLQVILMPIILLSKPRGSEWRGVIKPPDWDDWWRQYREFITYFCEIARDGRANALVIGSELVSAEKFTDRWLEIIALAREHFYGGKLGYSANWDHYKPVKFWHELDFVGMTSYYTLADKNSPTIEEIVAWWQPIHQEVTAWQRQIGKPLLFTEVGWCSQEGAATAPWNYYHNQRATPAGHEEQRRLYEAFLRVWDGTPGVAGIVWWEWSHDPGGAGDFGYAPRGKPAEQVLWAWFERHRPVTTQPAGPSSATAPTSQASP